MFAIDWGKKFIIYVRNIILVVNVSDTTEERTKHTMSTNLAGFTGLFGL